MTGQEPHSNWDRGKFARDAKASLFSEAGERECPSGRVLAEYVAGRLPVQDSQRVRQHIDYCGYCDALVSGTNITPSAQQGSLQRRTFWVAAIAILAVLIVWRWNPLLPMGAIPAATIATALPIYQLPSSRSAATLIPQIPSQGPVLLSGFIPRDRTQSYSFRVVSETGSTIQAQTPMVFTDTEGNFVIQILPASAPPGRLNLEVHAAPSNQAFKFQFDVLSN